MKHSGRNLYHKLVPAERRKQLYKLRHPVQYRRLRTVVHPSPKGDFSLRPFDRHRCIFVHVTKTAGTSVATALFGYLPYHHTAIDYRVIYGRRTFDRYFKFAYVRNPWDRLYSAYRYLKNGGWDDKDRAWATAHLGRFYDFNTFVKTWLDRENMMRHVHFWPQSEFLCDAHGRLLIDYVAYFETLEQDFERIKARLGIDARMRQLNRSPRSSYLDAYDAEARAIVGQIYQEDIERFGYSFDGPIRRATPALEPAAPPGSRLASPLNG